MYSLRHYLATTSPEMRGLLAIIATMTVSEWCSVAVALCTCAYLVRKTLLLQPAVPVATDLN
jgi:hypothetical protein